MFVTATAATIKYKGATEVVQEAMRAVADQIPSYIRQILSPQVLIILLGGLLAFYGGNQVMRAELTELREDLAEYQKVAETNFRAHEAIVDTRIAVTGERIAALDSRITSVEQTWLRDMAEVRRTLERMESRLDRWEPRPGAHDSGGRF